jgi:hypothetical protein
MTLSYLFFGNSTFNTIGEVELKGPSCEIPIGGGECEIYLTMPENTEFNSVYSLDVRADTVVDQEFKDLITLEPFTIGGPYVEIDSSTRDEAELYLYRVPASWKDIYEINFTNQINNAVVQGIESSRTKVKIQNRIGIIDKEYPFDVVNECDNPDTSVCDRPNLLINVYSTDSATYVKDYDMNQIDVEVLEVGYSTGKLTGNLIANAIITSSEISEKDNVLYSFPRKYINNPATGYIASYDTPFITTASWKQEYFATDLRVSISDLEVVEYNGKREGRLYLPDISQQLNDYCGRDGVYVTEAKECVIPLTFSSTDATTLTIVSELGQLSVFEADTIEELITGNITYDFENKPVGAGVTSFVTLLVAMGLLFIIRRVIKNRR